MPGIVQDAADGTVLTLAYMDAEALRRTLATGRSWFYSRSRKEYWQKGETSGDRQYVREVRLDCDGDALVVLVDQHGRGAATPGSAVLLPEPRDGARGCPRRDGRAARARAALDFRPDPPSSPRWPRSTPSSPCGARWWPTRSRPCACFANVVGEGDGFLFESVEGGERWGRYSFVGRRPLATLTARGGRSEAAGRSTRAIRRRDPGRGRRAGDPLPVAGAAGLPPLHGGLVGYLGYDVVREVERLPEPPSDDLGHPDAALVVIGQFCAFDHWRQRIVLVDNVVVPDAPDGVVDDDGGRGLRRRLRPSAASWPRTAAGPGRSGGPGGRAPARPGACRGGADHDLGGVPRGH